MTDVSFKPEELARYARHIVLREIGGAGQKRLKAAKVLIIGAGGLGSPAALYLAAAGVGRIGIIDDDVVEATNLQRQILHSEDGIGAPKVQSAKNRLQALNPYVDVLPIEAKLDASTAAGISEGYDVILDGTDQYASRIAANDAAVALGIPLISGALGSWDGQVTVFDPKAGTGCYACLFPQAPDPSQNTSCASTGVAAPLPGIIGTMMAAEAVKLITGAGDPLRGRMLIYDALYAEARNITLSPNPDCATCADIHKKA
ncbi:MAG: HesA/MoeB/ThiF family protein [Planktomarina sp.]